MQGGVTFRNPGVTATLEDADFAINLVSQVRQQLRTWLNSLPEGHPPPRDPHPRGVEGHGQPRGPGGRAGGAQSPGDFPRERHSGVG